MNESYGKFGSKDPEDLARAATINKTVTPQLSFDKLAENVEQARAKGPVYDSTWTVLECLVMEIKHLRGELAELKQKVNQ